MKETNSPPSPLLAAPLQKGDTIGLVSPAGPVQDEKKIIAGIRLIREMGFEVKFLREQRLATEGYLAGSDQDRADEFNRLWADPGIKALLAVRGGYGCLRMAGSLDSDLIRQNPKMLIGFSDITVLLHAVLNETDLITFHGPVLSTLTKCDRESVQTFFATLTGRFPARIKPAHLEILVPGRARGRLLGGNLTTLVHLVATPYEPAWDGALLFLEDTDEPPYRVDRLLTHLKLAQRLNGLRGLILGSFTAGNSVNVSGSYTDPVWNRVLELMAEQDIPVWANFPIGHGTRNHILPLGIEAEMDSGSGTLRFLEPCTA